MQNLQKKMKPKYKRLYFISILLLSFFFGCAILFINLKDNLVYFYSPSEILNKQINFEKKVRLGGMVEVKSLQREVNLKDGKKVEKINFILTDFNNSIDINYIGILPDLFGENQGVIVEGFFKSKKEFNAIKILAKHDENYMPPDVKEVIQNQKDL